MKELAIVFDAPTDSLRVMVPHAVSRRQMMAVAKAGYDIDRARHAAASGDQRELLGRRLAAYEAGRVQQLVGKKGDVSLFTATQGTGRIISLGT